MSANLFLHIGATAIVLPFFLATGARTHPTALWLGVTCGVFMAVAVIAFFYHMKSALLAVSWTVIGLSIVIPVAVAIMIWGERPTTRQWVGLGLIPVAFVCFAGNGKSGEAES